MASVEAVTMTESALAEQVKVFITRFRKNGQYTYVDKIDAMMPKRIKAAVIDYNDLVAYPMLDSMFNENPDRILRAFSAAIGEILYERFPDYAIKIRDDIRARIVNYPVQRSLREINAEIINNQCLLAFWSRAAQGRFYAHTTTEYHHRGVAFGTNVG